MQILNDYIIKNNNTLSDHDILCNNNVSGNNIII